MGEPLVRAVPVLASSEDLRLVKEALKGNPRFFPLLVSSWDELGELCLDAGLCVVGVDGPDDENAMSHVRRLQLVCPGAQVVLATGQPPRGRARMVDLLPGALVSLRHDAGGLPKALARTSFDVRERALRRRVLDSRAVPGALRGTLWRYLRLGPEKATDGYECIAKALGTTARTVRRQARRVGLDLRPVWNGWLGVSLAKVREFEGTERGTLGRRIGYRWLSGLSEFYGRTFDMTLRKVDEHPAEWLLARFEEEALGPLWAYQARSDMSDDVK